MSQDRQWDDWDALLDATAAFQGLIPGSVLVGGTAAAIHAGHRFSNDADLTIADLKSRFDELLNRLESHPEWELDRRNAPVMIMGSFRGVETTLRQLIRAKPLETETVAVRGHSVTVPTLAEMIRVKGWLALTRNAFRDYLDLAALSHHVGDDAATEALLSFDDCYKDVPHRRVAKDVSPLLQLARQLADPLPGDLRDVGEVARYKGIVPQWDDWEKIRAQCRRLGVLATNAALDAEPALDHAAARRASAEPRVPPYPEGTHKAFLLGDGETVVIRERDEKSGEFYKIGNTLGPAIVGGGKEIYALHGERMDREEWLARPEVRQAGQETRTGPP